GQLAARSRRRRQRAGPRHQGEGARRLLWRQGRLEGHDLRAGNRRRAQCAPRPRRVMPTGAVWRLQLRVADARLAERATAALETVCRAVSAFEESGGGAWLVEGFSEVPLAGVELETALALAWAGHGPPPEPALERLPARDWVRENQESFPPRRVGRYFIHGSYHR